MTLLLCILIFVLAGLTKGVLGLGLPTVAISLLALLMTPAEAAALLLIPSLLTNVWQFCAGPSPWPTFKRLLPLQLALVPGTLLSIPLLTGGDGAGLAAALGAVLVAYGLVGWTGWCLPAPGRHEGKVAPLVGFITGLITGMTGVFVLPAVPYLQSLALDREQLIEALGLTFTVATLALLLGLWWQDALAVERLGVPVCCCYRLSWAWRWASACASVSLNACSAACSLADCCCWAPTPSCIICCAWAILAEPVTAL